MRSVTLDLNVLVRDPVNDNPWPGLNTTITFDDAACPAGSDEDPTEFLLEQGFVVMGFDASASDSVSAPGGWQYYNQGEATDLIPLWVAQSLEWHAATKITCSNDPDNFWIVSDSFYDVQADFNICCGAATYQTQVLALKTSGPPLTPGSCPSCGTEAIFKSIAIKGSTEPRTLVSGFKYVLRSADNDPGLELVFELDFGIPLNTINQRTMRWPDDFIGLTATNDISLIANDQEEVPGSTRNVADYDCGTVEVTTMLWDPENDLVITETSNTWALPVTNCGPDCLLPYPPGGFAINDADEDVAFNQSLQLAGTGPFQLNVITKPAWMTVTLNPTTGAISLTGTPTDPADETLQFVAENCGEDITPETAVGDPINFTIRQVLSFTSRTPAANRTWYKVAWGAGLFVAIKTQGTDAQVMTSPDGVTWTSQVVPEDLNWNDICFSPDLNLFVAVAQGGSATEVMTSPDGITWTPRNQAGVGQWRGVCWAPALGLFVAVGTLGSSRVMTSPDGINWTLRTAAALNNWYGVTWSPDLGLLVAVGITGTGNRIMTSPDGINWTSRVSPSDVQWRKVAWGNGVFVAVADSGAAFARVMTSPDGITWTMGSIGSANFSMVAFGGGIFVAIANTGGTGPRTLKSSDGITWDTVTSPNVGWLGLAYDGASVWVITGDNVVATAPWIP